MIGVRRRWLGPILLLTTALGWLVLNPPAALPQSCSQTLSPGANLASAVSAAAAGSVICLNSGTYSSFALNGVSKNPRVTIRSTTAKDASIAFTLSGGTNGIDIDSVTVRSGAITGSTTRNITVRNSAFVASNSDGKMVISGPVNSNILFDNNTHNNLNVNPRFHLSYGASQHSGVTIQNSSFDGGCADGIQAGVGVNIYYNRFTNMLVGNCPNDPHVDAVQMVFHSGEGPHIKGNYFYNNQQMLTAFDRVANAIIEHNVLDSGPAGRPWGIEWFSDSDSIIRHNTLIYRSNCLYNLTCGRILLDHKTADPAGKGTIVVDNIATSIDANNGSTYAERHNNLVRSGAATGDITGSPTFVGGTIPTTWDGFLLVTGSLGKGAASDPPGSDVGMLLEGPSGATPPAAPTGLRISWLD